MNQSQTQIAVAILEVLSEHNGRAPYSGILAHITELFGDTNQVRGDRVYVINKLEVEYQLIRRQNALVFLSDNGELAKKMGFDRYIKDLHSNQRLDIKLKRIEFYVKVVELLKSSPAIIMFVTALLWFLAFVVAWSRSMATEITAGVILFLGGLALGCFITWLKYR